MPSWDPLLSAECSGDETRLMISIQDKNRNTSPNLKIKTGYFVENLIVLLCYLCISVAINAGTETVLPIVVL